MKFLLTGVFALLTVFASAQYDPDYKKRQQEAEAASQPESPLNVGLGIGLDFGGIGVRMSGYPIKNVGLFGGVGYNLVKAGLNGGAIVRILPDKKVCPVVTAMYGYNGVVVVDGADRYNKVFYGPTVGGGIELHFANKQNFMSFGLLFPIRSREFYDYWDFIKTLPGMEVTSDPLPFAPSIGYHFKLD